MLFRLDTLQRIASGEVTVAFRRWKKPAVEAGGTQRSELGVIAFDEVEAIEVDAITSGDAKSAGFSSLDELRDDVASMPPGTLYRVRFHHAGDDPRLALRDAVPRTDAEKDEALRDLARVDRKGTWAMRILETIESRPAERAGNLAQSLDMDTLDFKRRVRRLKDLGLTESLGTGYRLSPRGEAVLALVR